MSAFFLSAALPPAILFCGGYFLIYLRGFFALHPIKTVRLMFSGKNSVRELSVSLAGALGVGNIVGVAVAISLGGAGAVFWMWISALVAMILKYCEIVLSVKYHRRGKDGYFGGPMYYMCDGIGGRTGKALAAAFSALGLVGAVSMGNIVQVNAASSAAGEVFGIQPLSSGLFMCAACVLVIFGGFSGISKFTSVAVPVMSAIYLGFSVYALIVCRTRLGAAFSEIFSEALKTDSAFGGIIGFISSSALRHGVSKGVFSHEAGSGTAPMAHAKTENPSPAAQGTLGLFEVFFDTLVMCTLTALVILTSGEVGGGEGMALVVAAFSSSCGAIAKYAVSVSVIIFAFSTVICWAYYGRCCISYFTSSALADKIYMCVYCGAIILGSAVSEKSVWELSDITVALMTIINLSALLWLRRDVKKETDAVFCRVRRKNQRKAANSVALPNKTG